MRVAGIFDEKAHNLVVFEVKELGYDDNITDIDEGKQNRIYNKNNISGLYIIDYRDDTFFIKDVSLETCNRIAQELLIKGYVDLSSYGIILPEDEFLEEDCNINTINCSTCKNNVEFPRPHTCDICTSLDQEQEYGMWEAKV